MVGDYICRVCEGTNDLEIIFKKENEGLLAMLKSVANVSVEPNDCLPKCICVDCRTRLEMAYNFRIQCECTDQKWRDFLRLSNSCEKADENRESSPKTNVFEDITIKQEEITVPCYTHIQDSLSLRDFVFDQRPEEEQYEVSRAFTHSGVKDAIDQSHSPILTNVSKHNFESYTILPDLSSNEVGEEHEMQSRLNCIDIATNSPKILTCDICGRTFSRVQRLRQHKRLHLNPKPYSCEVCGKTFTESDRLRCHRKLHLNPNLFKCEKCGKVLSDRRCYTRHQQVHTGEFQYANCHICHRVFTTRYNFKRHFKRKHKDVEPNLFDNFTNSSLE